MRRLASLTVLAVIATATAATASASFQPIRRPTSEASVPRVRAGSISIPRGHARARVRVIVRLGLAPLAAWNGDRGLAFARTTSKLDLQGTAARRYLAQIDSTQRVAVAQLHAAIPAAQVQERYRVVLDGFAVSLPAKSLPKLVRLGFVTRVFPSIRYTATLDRGPSVIHAGEFHASTGDNGEGVKIAVVDTGVDKTSPFLDPTGFTYPSGFPKGQSTFTTPKVIVARDFPAPGSDPAGKKAFDATEPHGTHVSGIAAGDAGTNAPAGADHPATTGLSGVAPHAFIGNYRVFNIPTPFGHSGDTPEIAAAFEQAVVDGMDVINFSGGGAETDPVNDALVEVTRNVARAGVVPVFAAGNDRDDFGLGSAGSPGTAPDSISVAATSNAHVFSPQLTVLGGPSTVQAIPIQGKLPARFASADQTLVDVSTILGSDGKSVDAKLCGRGTSPNTLQTNLPKNSLTGAVALVSRGTCAFVVKAEIARRAGAIALILVDNRPGEANPIPIRLRVPAGMIADLDGSQIRGYLATTGGRGKIRVSTDVREIQTGRSGVLTAFSSAGPTDFSHDLKPDISAPGLDVLSSTPPKTTGSTFSVFAGTSMATPHVAGAAALLVQHHPSWNAYQVKSALMSTAGAAWGNTERTQEASVYLQGAGLANIVAADDPRIFTDPQSLSFQRVDISGGAQSKGMLLTVSDAGNGAGTYTVSLAPQAQTSGVSISVPGSVDVMPGGESSIPVVVHAAAGATPGEQAGFVIFTQGSVARRVPYAFLVERPALRDVKAVELQKFQTGDTRKGISVVSRYCCPSEPFGPPPDYTGAPMDENGSEHLYTTQIGQPVANFGVSVLASSAGAQINPWVLGSKDENDVQGYAGTPVNINDFTSDAHVDIGAAGAQYPRLQRLYVSVDSRRDPFTGESLGGTYLLNAWVNDVTPPALRLLTTRVAAGRPLLVAQAADQQSGVDPLSLVIQLKGALIGASAYDPLTGLILFALPSQAPRLTVGKTRTIIEAADYQESKNIDTPGTDILPNTAFRLARLKVVDGPAVTWVLPFAHDCTTKTDRLVVVANSSTKLLRVEFRDGKRTLATVRRGPGGVYSTAYRTAKLQRGVHHLTATAVDRSGRRESAGRLVRVCR